MPVARAYLEHHVVLAVLLHELLAVAHVPAQICEVGWGKRSARGSPRRSERQIAAAESRRTFLQSLEVIRLDRELVLDRLQGRHRGLCPLARVRRARSEWRVGSSSSRESSACESARRTSDFKIFVSGHQSSVRRANEAPTFSPVSHTPARPSLAGARARGGMFYSVDLLSPKGALGQIWVRRTRTTRLAPAPSARFPLSSSVPVLHPPSTERV